MEFHLRALNDFRRSLSHVFRVGAATMGLSGLYKVLLDDEKFIWT